MNCIKIVTILRINHRTLRSEVGHTLEALLSLIFKGIGMNSTLQ